MKKFFNKKHIALLLIIVLLLGVLSGCKKKETKTITNIKKETDIVEETTDIESKDEEDKLNEEEDKDKDEAEKEEEKKNEDVENNDEEDKKDEVKKEQSKEDNVVVIDGNTYKDYKGPVQGEIKYKEGTPNYENSQDLKASGDIESNFHVDLRVTTGFGQKSVFAKNVGMVKDEVGMEVLFRNLDVQTAYGGGFVNAINGIESKYTFYTGNDRKKLDWFYWVNGILAPIGVGEYKPQHGDVIWWDYHDWSVTMFIPAVIGSYPQPFKSGFQGKNPGTVIMYTDPYANEAEALKKSLQNQGVKQIDVAKFDGASIEKPKKYYILLGIWDDLVKCSNVGEKNLLEDINKKNKLIGVNSKFADGKIHALNFKGKKVTSYTEGGAIFAYAAGIGSTKPVWVVTGTNDAGFKMAYNLLLNESGKIKDSFGVVVSKNGVEKVPYLK